MMNCIRYSRSAFMLSTLITLSCVSTLAAAPFSNGDFESPNVSPYNIYLGGTGPGPWVYGTNGGVLWDESSGISPAGGGDQMLGFNAPTGPSGASQTFDVTPYTLYRVDFLLSGIADGGADQFNVDVTATNTPTLSYGFNTGSAANFAVPTYVPSIYTFATDASQTQATLTFQSTLLSNSGAYYGPVIDNVVLTAIADLTPVPAPEPSSIFLIGLGLLAFRNSRKPKPQNVAAA